ncbi:MAG: IMPACT family protein [Halanaeroarchaeum sp.]
MTDRDGFRTLEGPGEARFEIQGSEFIGHARPVDTREGAEQFVESIEDEYAEATHNVPAYRVRVDSGRAGHLLREYQSDDGEPTGSSGKPALNVLQQQDIENVVVVVTRYYGGTNLGVGGLARAYSRAVKAAVEDAGVIEKRPHERFAVTVEYDDSGTVRGILESSGVEFDADYETVVRFEVRAPVDEAPTIRDRIRSATSGRATVE